MAATVSLSPKLFNSYDYAGLLFDNYRSSVVQMVDRNITRADVDAVPAAPTKEAPGLNGCVNLWGYGPSKKRIRVTLDPTRTRIITVANADSRIEK